MAKGRSTRPALERILQAFLFQWFTGVGRGILAIFDEVRLFAKEVEPGINGIRGPGATYKNPEIYSVNVTDYRQWLNIGLFGGIGGIFGGWIACEDRIFITEPAFARLALELFFPKFSV